MDPTKVVTFREERSEEMLLKRQNQQPECDVENEENVVSQKLREQRIPRWK